MVQYRLVAVNGYDLSKEEAVASQFDGLPGGALDVQRELKYSWGRNLCGRQRCQVAFLVLVDGLAGHRAAEVDEVDLISGWHIDDESIRIGEYIEAVPCVSHGYSPCRRIVACTRHTAYGYEIGSTCAGRARDNDYRSREIDTLSNG